MAKKVITAKTAEKKPVKKVRSFNVDDRIYNGLMEIFERSGTQVTLSVLVDEFLRKLYVYLLEAESLMERRDTNMPLSQVVYDCMNMEYFRESNKENKRISNLILSHQASQQGYSLTEYMRRYPELFED